MTTILLSFLLALASASDLVAQYNRVIMLSSRNNLGALPPIPVEVQIAAVLDTNHSRAISSGWYTQESINAFRQDSFLYFKQQTGLDFTQGFTDPGTGMVFLGSVTVLPYFTGLGNDIHVTLDTADEKVGKEGNWYGHQFGLIVAFGASGTYTSGVHAGETYSAGQLLADFQYHLFNLDRSTGRKTQRQTFTIRSALPVHIVPNGQGFSELYSKQDVTDSAGNVGLYSESLLWIKDPVTGDVLNALNVVMTF